MDFALTSSAPSASAPHTSSSPRYSLILMYAGAPTYDPFTVTLTDSDSLLHAGPHRLLAHNPELLEPMLEMFSTYVAAVELQREQQQHHAASQSRGLNSKRVIGEFALVLLHILDSLHSEVMQRPGATLLISMLPHQALTQAACAGRLSPSRRPAHSQPLLFSANSADSPVRLRWCATWSDAADASPAPSVIYLPSLTWLLEKGSAAVRLQLTTALLDPLGAHIWPPVAWDALLEHKDRIYACLNKYMLKALWVALAAVGNDLDRVARELLSFSHRNNPNASYYIKGSFSCAGICAKRITVVGGKCDELALVIKEFVGKQHQHCVGIQPYVEGFEQFELRTWMVADAQAPLRWRPALTVKTSMGADGRMTAEQFQPLHGPGLRIAQLVDDMLTERTDFFGRMFELKLSALRVDCGWDPVSKRAFFNEFSAAGDANMWSEVHGQDLAYVVGCAAGEQLFARVLEGPRTKGTALQ